MNGRRHIRRLVACAAGLVFLAHTACQDSRVDFRVRDPNETSLAAKSGNGVHGDDGPVRQPTDSRLRLATRQFVASTLRDIFSPAPGSTSDLAVTKLVRTQVLPFGGGPCDPHDIRPSSTPGASDPVDRFSFDCPSQVQGVQQAFRAVGGANQAETVPPGTSLRGAVLTRACDKIAVDDAAITAAAVSIGGATGNAPDAAKVKAAFELFYPGRTPSEQVLTDLGGVVTAAAATAGAAPIEGWRFLFLTLCYSPGWQIP